MAYPPRHSCIEFLNHLFVDPPKEAVTPEEVFRVFGRDVAKLKLNRAWLANKLMGLRQYGFVETSYAKRRYHELAKIQLTPAGEEVLVAKETIETADTLEVERPRTVTLESIAKLIRGYERQNPSVTVELRLTIRWDEPDEPSAKISASKASPITHSLAGSVRHQG